MEVVVDYEYLTGARGEEVPKKDCCCIWKQHRIVSLLTPYPMNPHASPTSGLSWEDGIIPYSSLVQTLQEATDNFPHLYSKGDAKCTNLSTLLRRSVQNLDSFGCPERSEFRMTRGCTMTCHMYPDKSCALRNSSNFYGWLLHHIQDKEYVKCPKDDTRHTAIFNSAVEKKLNDVIYFSL
jgi:hypothetical protein